MTVADNVRMIRAKALPRLEAIFELMQEIAEIRDEASDMGLDWSALRAVLNAQIRDAYDGGDRVARLEHRADCAYQYVRMIAPFSMLNVAEYPTNAPQSTRPPAPQKPALVSVSSDPTESAVSCPHPPDGGEAALPAADASPPTPANAASFAPDPVDDLDIRNYPGLYRGA